MATKYSIKQLMEGLDYKVLSDTSSELADEMLSDVSSDSRNCCSSTCFIAIAGVKVDGHDYVSDAIANGSRVIVVQSGVLSPEQCSVGDSIFIEVENTSYAYSILVANLNGNPAEKLKFIGVTGTNGKTTITYLVEDMLSRLGYRVGVVGTVNNRYVGVNGKKVVLPTSLTTPDAKILQSLFRDMVEAGVSHVIMEVSSHAIAQSRIAGISFDVAAFTNLSRDHLDYHGEMGEYFATKCQLFTEYLKSNGVAVVPTDDRQLEGEFLPKLSKIISPFQFVGWGEAESSDVQLEDFNIELGGTRYNVIVSGRRLSLRTDLVGRFNIDNLLATIAICRGLGVDVENIQQKVEKITGAPGRIERIADPSRPQDKQPVVFVDYAHTPDALEKLLATLKTVPHGELISVFGCGGDRDNGKRPVMGGVGAELSDVVIVTNDNPRTEDPERILKQVVAGVKEKGLNVYDFSWLADRTIGEVGCVVIPDRRDAIQAAIRLAGAKDIVAIAGKGHEPYQLGIDGKRFFDDRLEALEVLTSWTFDTVVEAVRGSLCGGRTDILLKEVATDSRSVQSGDIFVALKGENHDGHKFIQQAVDSGAGCLVVEEKVDINCPQVVVADTTVALGDLAKYRRLSLGKNRNDFTPKVIGLTGSSGKTTTKEMVASILKAMWSDKENYPQVPVLKTQGNFNNLIGLPLSLLPLSVQHRAAILEMGMNSFGEIARLTEIAEPDVCCILNVQGAHLEGLGSIEGVAKAKGELFDNAKSDAVFVVNLDDENVTEQASHHNQKKITFSTQCEVEGRLPDFYPTDIENPRFNLFEYTLHHGVETCRVQLNTPGEHNVANSLAASAIAFAVGATLQNIVDGLASYRPPQKRMECLISKAGFTVINDCYNANPSSMKAALKTLASSTSGQKIAILGDMFELGDGASAVHGEIGELVSSLVLSQLIVVGEYAETVKQNAIDGGMPEQHISAFEKKEALHEYLEQKKMKNDLETEDVVLVKGSRGMKMETVIPFFIE